MSILGSSNQQHQVITKNTECSVLNFSVYSNESDDILFLTTITQETPSLVGDYYNDYMWCIKFKTEYINDLDCDGIGIDTESRNTPLFINIDLLPCPPGFILYGYPYM